MKNLLGSSVSVCGLVLCMASAAPAQAPAKAAPPAVPAKQETAPKPAATPAAGTGPAAKAPTAKMPTGPTSKAEQAGMWAQYRPGDPNGKTPPAKTAGAQAATPAKK